MGRVKSTAVKTLGNKMIREHSEKFGETFENNKAALNEIKKIKSKKIRNILAGYITRKIKRIKKTGI